MLLPAAFLPGLSSCALMVKPIPACGVAGSHSMALALDAAALPALAVSPAPGGAARGGAAGSGGGSGSVGANFEGPVVVQEFANHGGFQYKAYAIGSRVRAHCAHWCRHMFAPARHAASEPRR